MDRQVIENVIRHCRESIVTNDTVLSVVQQLHEKYPRDEEIEALYMELERILVGYLNGR